MIASTANSKSIRPRRLSEGDLIGVVSLSSPLAGKFPRRFERGIDNIRKLGFRVRVGGNACSVTGHTAGTPEQRAMEFNEMVSDPDVRAIVSAIGGYNSSDVLELIDFDSLNRKPKILLGYSDFTTILLAAYARAGLTTFLGPAVMPQFGEFDGIDQFTLRCLQSAMCSAKPLGKLPTSNRIIEEFLMWDEMDMRSRKSRPNRGPRAVIPGAAEGYIVAGNIGTLLGLVGTPWLPPLDGAILCLEDDEVESPATVQRMLMHLRHANILARIHALVIGRFPQNLGFSEGTALDEILHIVLRNYNIPVVVDFDFGHTDPMLTLPNGVKARLLALSEPSLVIDEPAVS